jgi:hypothetical protein
VAAARTVLAHQPRQSLRKQFEQVLTTAQRYARLREDIVSHFTLAWPVLRRAVLRLGEELVQADVVGSPEDIFFLTRAEVLTMVRPSASGSLRAQVSERRQTWNKQRALTPPLVLGQIPHALMQGIGQLEAALAPRGAAPDAILHGLPASPGQATGPVRIIRTPPSSIGCKWATSWWRQPRRQPGRRCSPALLQLLRIPAASWHMRLSSHANTVSRASWLPETRRFACAKANRCKSTA